MVGCPKLTIVDVLVAMQQYMRVIDFNQVEIEVCALVEMKGGDRDRSKETHSHTRTEREREGERERERERERENFSSTH